VARLELRGVRKSFQSVEVIHGVDLTVESGAFAVLVGPSGYGKSTLLRMIAGLEDVTAGEIRLDGQRYEHLLPSSRGMAMVFQSYALYPHMSVRENLRFGLVCHKVPKTEIAERIARAAEILRWSAAISPRIFTRSSAWRLDSGSSNRNAFGSFTIARPIATRWLCPPDNCDGCAPANARSAGSVRQ
jgi:ABC-type sugar transport system ATPase subunit